MTNFTASPSSSAGPRRRVLGLLAALIVSASALVLVAPASAIVTEVAGTPVGLQPRNAGTSYGTTEAEHKTFANESGHAVLHGTKIFPIYWDPAAAYHHEWQTDINSFFQRVGASSGSLSNIFAALGQYRDRTNGGAVYSTVYKGSYTDTAKYPLAGCADPHPLKTGAVTCLTDAQLREQLQSFIASHGLPKGMNTVYYLLTPPGVTVCVDAAATRCSDYSLSKAEEEAEEHESVSYENSFCSYHSNINPSAAVEGDANTILYAAIPWTAGTAGLFTYVATKRVYAQAWDCQDGGISPVNAAGERIATPEESRELTKEEEEAFAEMTKKEKEEFLKTLRLEGPHQQEPNQQERVSEEADYGPGLADLIINQIAEEQANMVTNPMLNAWHDASGREVTDECRNVFNYTVGVEGGEILGSVVANLNTEAGTLSNTELSSPELPKGDYYLNNIFSLGGGIGGCAGGAALVPRFTAPNPVNANEIVGFDGMESTVGLMRGFAFGPSGPPTPTYSTFSWNFGDGTPLVTGYAPGAPLCEAPWLAPCAASIFHSYVYGGNYKVSLTVTDLAGNVSRVEHEISVVGPPAPVTPGGSGAGAGAIGKEAIVAPFAAASIVSHSLKRVLKKGLVVRYSVNEKVTGHFEVMISRALATRLHTGGAPANNLPAGTAPQIVIAKAILVTTKGGHSTITIKLSKKTAARLGHMRNVSVLLRLVIRNAAPTSPQTAVVLSKATLSG